MGITITTLEDAEDFRERILKKVKNIKKDDIDLYINEKKIRNYTLFNINFYNTSSEIKRIIARIVAEYITEKLEIKLIHKIVENKYKEYDKEEKDEIKYTALKYLNLHNNSISGYINQNIIMDKIMNYLDEFKTLNIEGFVQFRLKKYNNKLKKAVKKAVDEIVIDKEYNEFVDLLKYFVELQDPKMNQVNVIKNDKKNSYQLLDEKKKIISNEYLINNMDEIMDEKVEIEDLLISALINISPRIIILHFEDKEVENTLKDIFCERIKVCDGCELCSCKIKT